MTFYEKYFAGILLENPSLPSTDNNTQLGLDAAEGKQSFMDSDSDPNSYDVEGIANHKNSIISRFMSKIQGFSNKLAPEAIKTSTFGSIKDNVSNIFKEIDKVNTYSTAKVDQLSNEAPAIIAVTISGDPAKKAAFEKLHKELSDFISSIEEVEGKFATLKAKIEDFGGDIKSAS